MLYYALRRVLLPLWLLVAAALAVLAYVARASGSAPGALIACSVGILAFALILGVLLVTSQYLRPLEQLAEWLQATRRGTRGAPMPRSELLKPLYGELERLARSLDQAREDAATEARLRLQEAEVWTPERLKEFARRKLGGQKLVAVSHREPYEHRRGKDGVSWSVPPSGLVTALEPVLRAAGGVWVAAASGDADFETADSGGRVAVPPDEPAYTLKRVAVPEEEEKGFYFGAANEGLWPLCHVAHIRPVFRSSDLRAYESANRRYADALLEEIGDQASPLVLIQDYHFALLPRLIRQAKPDARIAIFWHIPWPNPERFGICPWREKLLDGLLGADIVGFHLQSYCASFIGSVDRYLECRMLRDTAQIVRAGHLTSVRPYPIGIAFTERLSEEAAGSPAELKKAILAEHGIEAELLGVGVDRLDYTKGIQERFWAIEKLLEEQPSYVGRFTFAELGAPTRTQLARYAGYLQEVEAEAERINRRFATPRWRPIVFLKDQHDQATIRRYYRAAELCLVTSLHDGMNLVAMEYVAARSDGDGVLVLSPFTGAAEELKDALLVNPYDIDALTGAVRQALEMPEEERRRRMSRLRETIREHNVFRWAGGLIDGLCRVRPLESQSTAA